MVRRKTASRHRAAGWFRRRNRFGLRNGRLLTVLVIAVAAGAAVTVLTAYLGLR